MGPTAYAHKSAIKKICDYDICFADLFQTIGEPSIPMSDCQWDKKEEGIIAKINCILIINDQHIEINMPVYLLLAPDKPRIEIIEIEKDLEWKDFYFLKIKLYGSSVPAPSEILELAHITEDGTVYHNLETNKIYDFSRFYESNEARFEISAINQFGKTQGEPVYIRQYYLSTDTDKSESNICISPNPVKKILNIYKKGGENNISRITIIDISGKIIKKYKMAITQTSSLDVSFLAPGQYILQITDSKSGTQNFHFLKII